MVDSKFGKIAYDWKFELQCSPSGKENKTRYRAKYEKKQPTVLISRSSNEWFRFNFAVVLSIGNLRYCN